MATVGQRAPEVSLLGPNGAPVKLSEYVGKKTVVLYFYPKDETRGCTAQACSFRDAYQDFTQAGAEVIGVSADDEASHASFKSHHRLPFVLLSDPGGVAAKAFEVKKSLGLFAGRVTFVIDRGGVIRHRFESQLRIGDHVEQALALVKQLETRPAA
ncbi:MAG: peroxiredoxin [Myxococcus sp.]|nr:peroxiredoxin [Myxococcus sp.]